MGGFGPFNNERWHPGLTWVPEALATGNFDLRTHCRVVRVVTDGDGRASGVEYVDANGNWQVQAARTVILCGYTSKTCGYCCCRVTTITRTVWATTPARLASMS